MKRTNIIVTLLALSPMFCYIVLSSCTPSNASYGPINRDAIGRRYVEVPGENDSIAVGRARALASSVLGITLPEAASATGQN